MAPTRIEVGKIDDMADGTMSVHLDLPPRIPAACSPARANSNDLPNRKEVPFPNADSESKILLSKVGGKVYATSSTCTHYGAPLAKGVLTASGRVVWAELGDRIPGIDVATAEYLNQRVADIEFIYSPWHGACFDVCTGDIEDAPGLSSLQSFKVETEGKSVFVTPPADLATITSRRLPPSCSPAASSGAKGVVIVGGGAGAAHAIEGLRESGYEGTIKVISSEPYLPIDRTKLSKALIADPKKVALRDEAFYKNLGVEFKLSSEVTSVDFEADTVKLASGESFPYEQLIVATGSIANRIPVDGHELKNIFVMRNIEDVAGIDAALGSDEKVRKNVVVIGSSFIGMESALACAGRASVTVVGMEPAPFTAILGEQIGNGIRKFHESKGTKFYLPASLSHFTASKASPEDVGFVVLKDGTEIPADLVVLGVGVKPATGLLKASGIAIEKDGGVLVDENLRLKGVAHKNVFAIGDIAKFPDSVTGELTRVEHWNVASNHARSVAKTISGKEDRFSKVAVFWSAQGQQLRYAGTGRAKEWKDVLVQGDPDALKFIAYYSVEDEIVAVGSMQNDPIAAHCSELFSLGKMPSLSDIKGGKSPLDVKLA
ncbi:apoptosis-inducing factor 3, partial [Phenoliferia sp. Uapishka_3]